MIFLFNFLPHLVNFFAYIRTGIALPSLQVIVMIKTVTTPPRTLWFAFRRRIQTTHMILSVAITTTQQARRNTRITYTNKNS